MGDSVLESHISRDHKEMSPPPALPLKFFDVRCWDQAELPECEGAESSHGLRAF